MAHAMIGRHWEERKCMEHHVGSFRRQPSNGITTSAHFHWAELDIDAEGEWKMGLSLVPKREKETGW